MEKGEYKDNNEVLSKVLRAGKRTYFFDLKQTKNLEHYLTITESKRRFDETKGSFYYEKHKIFLHVQDIVNFEKELNEVIAYIQTQDTMKVSGNQNDEGDSSAKDSFSFDDLG